MASLCFYLLQKKLLGKVYFCIMKVRWVVLLLNILNLGLNYAYPDMHLSIATRMTVGLILGTVVFFADLYFIVKGMGGLDETSTPKV